MIDHAAEMQGFEELQDRLTTEGRVPSELSIYLSTMVPCGTPVFGFGLTDGCHSFTISRLFTSGEYYVGDSTDHIQFEDEEVYGPHPTAEDAVNAFLDWWEKFSYTMIGNTFADIERELGPAEGEDGWELN